MLDPPLLLEPLLLLDDPQPLTPATAANNATHKQFVNMDIAFAPDIFKSEAATQILNTTNNHKATKSFN